MAEIFRLTGVGTAQTAQDGTGSTITDTGTAATPDGRGTPLDATCGFLVIRYGGAQATETAPAVFERCANPQKAPKTAPRRARAAEPFGAASAGSRRPKPRPQAMKRRTRSVGEPVRSVQLLHKIIVQNAHFKRKRYAT